MNASPDTPEDTPHTPGNEQSASPSETAQRPSGVDGARDNSAGVAALVLGIVAVVAAANGWWVFLLPIALATGVLAVVFGVKGRRAAAAGRAGNPGQSLAGLVLGTTALSLVALGGVAWAVWGDDWKDDDDNFDECIDDADDVSELRICIDRYPEEAELLVG
jgi:hypothetical protein